MQLNDILYFSIELEFLKDWNIILIPIQTIMDKSSIDVSFISEENEFKNLYGTITNLQLELTTLQGKYQKDMAERNLMITNLEEILNLKDEEIIQLW